MNKLRVVLIKPSKYGIDGAVERFKKGFMPNATLYHIASLTPASVNGFTTQVHTIDEYVRKDFHYLKLMQHEDGFITLLALVGVQSHQFQRALDLAAYAAEHGVKHCVIGGPHVMTCDTGLLQNRGISFSVSEAENVWNEILTDALSGALKPLYGVTHRWAPTLSGPVIAPPSRETLKDYWAPMLGLYPVRGCPFNCNFCSVIKISGRAVRSESIDSTIKSLQLATKSGIDTVMFVSDNFNKYPHVEDLLLEIIKEKFRIRFFCQCDTQIARQPELIELLRRAGCFEIFIGVESFNRSILKNVRKFHNQPNTYRDIVRFCDELGIRTHFSNIVGFPDQTEKDIQDHVDCLKELRPKVASFYILTPIPGTEQYDTYSKLNLITESNLDRFDATYPTYSHPHISKKNLSKILFDCYVQYNRFLLRNVKLDDESTRLAIFNRYLAEKRMHPMAGGIDQIKIDSVAAYLPLREKVFGVKHVPLPESLKLSEKDELLNRKVKLK